MSVAVDATTEQVRTATTDPFTFSHAGQVSGSGGVQGVLVWVINGTISTDEVNAVTYGGVALTQVGNAVDTATELGRCQVWFGGSGLPAGSQTVSVDFTSATATDQHIVVQTLTGARDLRLLEAQVTNENATNPQHTQRHFGVEAMSFCGIYSGLAAPGNLAVLSGMTAVHDHDFGAFVSRVDRETTASLTDTLIGYTSAADDVAFVSLSIAEVVDPAPGPQIVGRSMNNAGIASNSAGSIVFPPGIEADDVALLLISGNVGGSTITPDAESWTEVGTQVVNSTTLYSSALWAVLGGTEDLSTLGIAFGTSNRWNITVVVIRGLDPAAPVNDFGSVEVAGVSTTITFASATPDMDGALVIVFPTGRGDVAGEQANFTGWGVNYTEIADQSTTNATVSNNSHAVAYRQLLAGAGNSVNPANVATTTNQTRHNSHTIILAPLPTSVNISRTGDESTPAVDTVARAVALARTGAESAPATEGHTQALTRNIQRTAGESAPAVDTATRNLVLARAPPESAPAVDTSARTSTRARPGAELAPAVDTHTRKVGRFRTASESAPAVESHTQQQGKGRFGSDSAPAVDTSTRSAPRSRSASESAPAVDTAARAVARFRTASESAPATDSVLSQPAKARGGSESAPAVDTVARAVVLARPRPESAPAVDTATRSRTSSRSGAESAPAVDTRTQAQGKARSGSESAPAVDTATRSRSSSRTGAESAPAVDTAVRAAPRARTASESAPAVDTSSHSLNPAGAGDIDRTASESAPAVDTAARSLTVPRPVGESASVGNRAPSLDKWTLAGGAFLDGDGNVVLPNTSATATSPLIPWDGESQWSFSWEAKNEFVAPNYDPIAGSHLGSEYFDAAGNVVNNTAGFPGNGHAQTSAVPLGEWSPRRNWTFGGNGGPAVRQIKIILRGSTIYTGGYVTYRRPRLSTGGSGLAWLRDDEPSTRQLSQARPRAESAPATDTATRSLTRSRTVGESAPAVDTAVRQVRRFRSSSESAPAADTATRQPQQLSRSGAESAPAVDVPTGVGVSGGTIDRPDSGLIPRPDSGGVTYTAGTVPRPYTSSITPPSSGTIERP